MRFFKRKKGPLPEQTISVPCIEMIVTYECGTKLPLLVTSAIKQNILEKLEQDWNFTTVLEGSKIADKTDINRARIDFSKVAQVEMKERCLSNQQ